KVIDNISSNRIRRMDRTDGSAKEKDVAPETTFTPRQVESFHQHAGHLPALRRAGQTAPSLHVLWLLPGAPGQSPRKHCDRVDLSGWSGALDGEAGVGHDSHRS